MIFTPAKKKARQVKLKPSSEKIVHQQVCDFLNMQFPEVVFSSDASGLRVTVGLRMEIARKSPNRYKVPDLIILEARKGYNGLVIEIKKDGVNITKRNGEYVNEHVEAQAKTLARLKESGYCSCFCVGFTECIDVIKDYLK